MMLKENEAKFKYCPYLTTREGQFRFCQGTMCMMWRYKDAGGREADGEGYCGLAGKPVGAA